jgi:hypothetical protein
VVLAWRVAQGDAGCLGVSEMFEQATGKS